MAKRGSRGGAKRARRGLAGVSVEALHAELERRSKVLSDLHRERDRVLAFLGEIEGQIEKLGGTFGARGSGRGGRGGKAAGPRKRPKNDSNLTEALVKLLTGKEMSVTDAAEAVQKAGYKTSSTTFRTIVNQTLLKGPFKKVSRGIYTAK